ncbi:MAG: hypothetical protein PHW02_05020 [bacterium]|nr:hypothetical protein [bacterium]
MKKILLLVIAVGFVLNASAVDYERKSFDKFGFSMEIPSNWNSGSITEKGFSYTNDDANTLYYSFYYSFYPFDSAGSTYADYSVFDEDYRKSIQNHAEEVTNDDYYEFDVLFTANEFVKINNRTFLHLRFDGLLWDEYYDDYSLPEIFDEIDYIVLKDGILHNFSIYLADYYLSDNEEKILEHIVRSISFK